MDLVSFEDVLEWHTLRHFIDGQDPIEHLESAEDAEGQYFAAWTSGRLCDFDGCERASHMKPVNDRGWFWSANNKKLASTSCVNDDRSCFHA